MIGPKTIIIPEVKIVTCNSCEYYSHDLVRSGREPIYDYLCNKVDLLGFEITDDRKDTPYKLRLHKDYNTGYVRTPKSCPFLKNIERDEKIEDILDDKE